MNSTFRFLFNLAFENGASVIVDSMVPVPFYNAKRKLIVVNDYQPFKMAHEVAHMLTETKDSAVLYLTYSKASIEGNANRLAIKLLARYYFEDLDKEKYNVDRFMKCYQIPSYLRDYCIKAIRGI